MGRRKQNFLEKYGFWSRHIEAKVRSGQTISEYCHEHGLSAHVYKFWRTQIASSAKPESRSGFLPVRIKQEAPSRNSMSTRIRLPNGVLIEMGDDVNDVRSLLLQLCGAGRVS